MDLFNNLNEEQIKAVKHNKGPLLILAGAGSGKTRVLTHRIAHLISVEGVNPWNIIALTFTNKAAREMRERIDDIVGYGSENIWVSTFHSTCVRILRRFIESIGYERNFTIYDTDDQKSLMKDIIKHFGFDTKSINEKKILSVISSNKDSLITPEMYSKECQGDYNSEKYVKAYTEYQKRLKKNNALDFDDLIMKTVELFRTDNDALEYYRRRFHYLLVDEYQDTNNAQFELIHLLAETVNENGETEHNICVVGDDDQSIYKFRGANIYNILNFEKAYSGTMVIRLEQNYRSTQNILNAANEVIINNTMRKSKRLWCDQSEGEPIHFVRYMTDYDEAQGITKDIRNLVLDGWNYNDFAILYRTNAQSRIFEENLINANIPYKIVGGINFYSRKEIKDVLAYLKTIDNGMDDIAVKRIINIPRRGIGLTTIDRISNYASLHDISFYDALKDAQYIDGLGRSLSKIQPFVALIEHYRNLIREDKCSVESLVRDILVDTGYTDALNAEGTDESRARIENLEEFINKTVSFGNETEQELLSDDSPTVLSAFLENVALVADIDSVNDDGNMVLLMTLHSSKGLEFSNVYICGMEENIFPSAMALYSLDDTEIEEERRLCYVGITRAMKRLTLSCAGKRMKNGELQFNRPSRFLNEIPRYLLNESAAEGYSQSASSGKQNSFKSQRSFDQTSLGYNENTSFKTLGGGKSANIFTNNPYISKGIDKTRQLPATDYKPGDRVKHIKFGNGTIESITKNDNDYDISVSFDSFGTRKMKSKFANLSIIE